jgi:hypothetical protein
LDGSNITNILWDFRTKFQHIKVYREHGRTYLEIKIDSSWKWTI